MLMKIVFAGSPDYAVKSLASLIEAGKQVVAVITQPNKPIGRKKILTPTPVKSYALAHGIPVYDFDKVSRHEEEVRAIGADIMITCAYGQILSKGILSTFPLGVWNLHASLLPKFRGASPIQSAILAGEEYTGVTVMRTEEQLDSGDMLLVKRCAVGDLTYGELSDKLSDLSAQAVVEAVELIENGQTQLLMQDEAKVTFCKKISKADAKVDFNKSAVEVVRLINAMSPSPAAYCNFNGAPLNLYKAQVVDGDYQGDVGLVISADKARGIVIKCGSGAIKLLSAQFVGGKVISSADIINGRKLKEGDLLD
jgi:methionyl-tRNA formyltransferase